MRHSMCIAALNLAGSARRTRGILARVPGRESRACDPRVRVKVGGCSPRGCQAGGRFDELMLPARQSGIRPRGALRENEGAVSV